MIINIWPLYLKLTWREFKHRFSFYLLFAANISLGLAALAIVMAVQSGITNYLNNNLRSQLAGDLEVFSRQPISQDYWEVINSNIPANSQQTIIKELVSVVRNNDNQQTKTAQIAGINSNYPLVGKIILTNAKEVDQDSMDILQNNPGVWISKDLSYMLGATVGDQIQIGNTSLEVLDIIEQAPVGTGFGSLVPKILTAEKSLLNTGLINSRSLVNYKTVYKLENPLQSETIKTNIYNALVDKYGNRGPIRVRSFTQANDNLFRLSNTTSQYLNAIAMLSFILAAMGCVYLFNYFYRKKQKDFAILKMLGINNRQTTIIFICQMFTQALLASLFTITIALAVIKVINLGLGNFISVDFEIFLSAKDMMKISFIAMIGLPVFCLPSIYIMAASNPNELFSEVNTNQSIKSKNKNWLWYLPSLALVLLITTMISADKNSYLILLIVAGLFGLLYLLAEIFMYYIPKFAKQIQPQHPWLYHACLIISRYATASKQCFIALSAATVLLFLIPGLYINIKENLQGPPGLVMPQFFIFNMNPEQVNDIQQFFTDQNLSMYNVNPMVRAELQSINNTPLLDWREKLDRYGDDQDDAEESGDRSRARRSSFNLSYKQDWNQSETIVEGPSNWPPLSPNELPKISIEKDFATDLGLKIGDEIQFLIDNQEIRGQVYNLRTIKWNYFYPNFFMIFQPGVLDQYNQILLANVNGIKDQNIPQLSFQFSQKFPNVTFLDVQEAVSLILKLSYGITVFILLIGLLAFITGSMALYSIILAESNNQRHRNNLFFVLGAPWKKIVQIVFSQYTLIVAFGTLSSGLLAVGMLTLVGRFLFQEWWFPNISLLAIILIITATTTVGWMVYSSLKNTKSRVNGLLS